MAAGLTFALGAGVVLAVLIPLEAGNTTGAGRVPELIQAHGWAQLQGFAGLFAAGMGLRLLPRLSGAPPPPVPFTVAVLVALVGGTALRVVALVLLTAPARPLAEMVAGALGGAGMAAVAAAFTVALARARRSRQGWWLAAWAAAGWWAVWAVLTVIAGVLGAQHRGLVPNLYDVPASWVALLGAIGNLVWAVQARSVPVFYGRPIPSGRTVAMLIAPFNLGVVVVLLTAVIGDDLLRRVGLALAGGAMLGLAPVCGSVRGRAHRLRPGSRPAARFVVAANRWGMLAGALLLVAAALTVWGRVGTADGLEDAALHAVGLGLVTTLIPGVARLLAPVFAIERTRDAGREVVPTLVLVSLLAATALRVLAGLVEGTPAEPSREPLIAAAGCIAWIGLLLFAVIFVRAWLLQGQLSAALRRDALASRRP